jgi:hypothetical protein
MIVSLAMPKTVSLVTPTLQLALELSILKHSDVNVPLLDILMM